MECNIKDLYIEKPFYLLDFNQYIQSRLSYSNRRNIFDLAKIAGIHDEKSFLEISKAISINDTLWVKSKESDDWDRINPYKNRISRVIAEISLNGIGNYNNENIKSPSPQYLIEGTVDKCVKRENGVISLYKTSGEQFGGFQGVRLYSDYYVSKLEDKLGFSSFVKYGIKINVNVPNNYYKPYSVCELFTNEEIGYIPSEFTFFSKLEFNQLRDFLLHIKDENSYNILCNMMLIDSLTLNIDRHDGNWGILVDNRTLSYRGLAPIYDNDLSFGSMISLQNKSFEDCYNELSRRLPKLGFGDFDEQLELALRNNYTISLMKKFLSAYNPKYFRIAPRIKSLNNDRYRFMHYILMMQLNKVKHLIKGVN